MADKEFFTPRDINPLIPQLETLLEHVRHCRARAEALLEQASAERGVSQTKAVVQNELVRSQVEFLMDAVQEDVERIQSLGGVPKDLDAGLVDFPGEIKGQEVWFCWKTGERQVGYWHSLDEGFAQRQALDRSDSKPTLH